MGGRKPARERGARYPLGYVASELGIDVNMLVRECTKAEIDTSNGLKFSEAHTALSGKIEAEKSRRRRQDAEVEDKEIDVLNKRKKFVFREDHINIVRDFAVQVRVAIESERSLPAAIRKRLAARLAQIKPDVAEPSHK